jgi:hypothetical protein
MDGMAWVLIAALVAATLGMVAYLVWQRQRRQGAAKPSSKRGGSNAGWKSGGRAMHGGHGGRKGHGRGHRGGRGHKRGEWRA